MESMGVTPHIRKSSCITRAESILAKTTRRVGDRWETGLLWKNDEVELPDNKDMAEFRLKSVEKRMRRDPIFAQLYRAEIEHLVNEGYATRLTPAIERRGPIWYLPHFAVTNPNKPNKLRVVFDAAAKKQGVSLNDKLLTGPDLTCSLLGVLMRFRQRAIAVQADIKEMFLRVKIREEDQHAQRFLWRGLSNDQKPETYCMTSLIFGATSSPCSAQYVKNMNSEEFKEEFPRAVEAIQHRHYVDDYLDSVDTEDEARTLIAQVTKIHKRGGFEIRAWASNRAAVLQGLPCGSLSAANVNLVMEERPYEKTLGLRWNPQLDCLSFNSNIKRAPTSVLDGATPPTKREMLRIIMAVYDPLGFLAPFTIRSRILLQQVWRSGIQWDEQLKVSEFLRWKRWTADLQKLESYGIPRCYVKMGQKLMDVELHVFCDASAEAYAAVAYWRTCINGTIHVAFIASKSRVAPLKPCSIPRLELQAALLAARLSNTIIAEHEYQAARRTLWTDSRTVLSWLHSDSHHFKAFVAHRLGEIDELTNTDEWRWITTKENPADDATRDVRISLDEETRWVRGPSFLSKEEKYWPSQPKISADTESHANIERKKQFVATNQLVQTRADLPDIRRFSSWRRLVRSTAWALLFIERCRRHVPPAITAAIISWAEELWVLRSQYDSFNPEIKGLQQTQTVNRESKLQQLSPTLDGSGILRVGGRVQNIANVPGATTSPVILDGQHPYTRLLVLHFHQKFGHASTETVVNEMRQKYWVTRLRPTIRAVAARCQKCRNDKAKPQTPLMGYLPPARVGHHQRPFTYCGVDYFGPMVVTIGRRHEKRWGVLFTCLTTRAVHLELASTLTTDSAIMALRRMAARRGWPLEVHSDNGTNFRGADIELRKATKEMDPEELQERSMNYGTTWHFIPPHAPHMGGCWERLVRSVKTALRVTLKSRAPREETLATLMTEVEHVINSRPLTHVSVDHRDEESLTPNHFLIGTSSGNTVPGKFTNEDLCLRKQWRIAQRLTDHFWSRWVREYLPTLIKRRRWTKDAPQLSVGDVVIIADHTLPRNMWPKGIVTKVFPGADGRVRVAEVETHLGKFIRPVAKIIVLPITPKDVGKDSHIGREDVAEA